MVSIHNKYHNINRDDSRKEDWKIQKKKGFMKDREDKAKMLKQSKYREKDIMCMTSTQWLVGIYNDAANKSWSKYTTLTK